MLASLRSASLSSKLLHSRLRTAAFFCAHWSGRFFAARRCDRFGPTSKGTGMNDHTQALLQRLVEALERLAPPPSPASDLHGADAFVWHANPDWLEPVIEVNRVDLSLLQGIDRQRDLLLDNTRRFAAGFPANNALLWGSRGTGKSSLVKAVHATINAEAPGTLALVEIHREDIPSLPRLLARLRSSSRR